jgi:predicted amidohydrolase
MKIVVAAVQMSCDLLRPDANLDRADAYLCEANRSGAKLAVLPELFNTGYSLFDDFTLCAESLDGPTLRRLSGRSQQWRMGIVAGFVERSGRHLYDSLALCLPDGSIHVYRKRHLVFWEKFRFRAGRAPLVVATPWGRIGLAICADMIYRRVWNDYRGRVDLVTVAAAWPEFASAISGRAHWLLGRIGPLSGKIPARVANDLEVPVVFANQCGTTTTTIPLLGLALVDRIEDRFAGLSGVCDGQGTAPVLAGIDPQLILSEVTVSEPRGTCPCRSTASTSPSAPEESCSGLA